MTATLDAVDGYYAGYDDTTPLAPVLDVWLRISGRAPSNAFFYITAAARRLDAARRLLSATESAIQRAQTIVEQNEPGQMLQIAIAAAVGDAELGVVALGRAADMAANLQPTLGLRASLNAESTATLVELKPFRDAYEHIDERALGHVWRKPHPDAHSAFDHDSLFLHRRVEYAGSAVTLDALTQLAADVRGVLKQRARASNLPAPPTQPRRLDCGRERSTRRQPRALRGPSGHHQCMADMDAVAELELRRRALHQEVKALIQSHIRGERSLDQNQMTELATELQRKSEQIEAELEGAYYRDGPADPGGSGGVREPVRPRPPTQGPGTAVVPPRD